MVHRYKPNKPTPPPPPRNFSIALSMSLTLSIFSRKNYFMLISGSILISSEEGETEGLPFMSSHVMNIRFVFSREQIDMETNFSSLLMQKIYRKL